MTPPKKYATEEERLEAIKRSHNNYSKRRVKCNICHLTYTLGNKTKHFQSLWHKINTEMREEGLKKARFVHGYDLAMA